MARTRSRPRPSRAQTLVPVTRHCPECQHTLWADSSNYRRPARKGRNVATPDVKSAASDGIRSTT